MGQEFSTATERDALCGYLDQQRDALVRNVRGVGDADARTTPTASAMSLLGILKHSALWEARWFQFIVAESEVSRQITADMGLDDRCVRHDLVDENLRWVLLHLIEETARHAGHADIIRETIDGTRGM